MNRIKSLRVEFGFSQKQLAERLGVVQSTLSYWERDKYDVDNASLRKMSELFNVSIDYILGNSATRAAKSAAPSKENTAAEFGQRLFAAHGDIAPEDFTQEDLDDVAMFLQLKKMKKDKKDG